MPTEKKLTDKIRPFANESDSLAIGEFTIENRLDRLECYGSIAITRDKKGLAAARALKAVIDATIDVLASQDLPDVITERGTTRGKNPFA